MATPSLSAESTLPALADSRRALALGWLWLALAALIGAGLFSVLLVLSRAPYVKDLFPLVDFFRVALIVHVDLSVLVWFGAFAGIVWTLNGTTRLIEAGWAALVFCATGTLLMCAAPFLEAAPPIMSNYVPVLDGRVFLTGLLVFAVGCTVLVLRAMLAVTRVGTRPDANAALRFGLNAAAVSA